jgi:hypothetical protein
MGEFYLIDNPPAVSQGRSPRRAKASGVIVVHTDEAPQQAGGSLGTAAFIARRRDYGSYHVIVDSTTVVRMLPPIEWECWGAAYPADTNTHAIHVAFRGQASQWGANPAYDEAAIANAGREIAHIMRMLYGDKASQYVKWITQADCINRVPGLVEHGTIQPGDRSDPWVNSSQKANLRERLSRAILSNLVVLPAPEGVDVKVNKPVMMQEPNGTVWIYYGGTPWRVHVKSPADVNVFRFMGVEYKVVDTNTAAFFRRYSQEVKCA